MMCQICKKNFEHGDLIIRGIVCKILNPINQQIECNGNYATLDMHFICFEQQVSSGHIKQEHVDEIEDIAIERNDALVCFA